MPHLLLFVPCQVALVDSTTNGLSIINIVETIGLIQLPGPSGGYYVASWWLKEPPDDGVQMIERVEIRDTQNRLCSVVETPFRFSGRGQRVLNVVPPFTVSAPGDHEFRLFIRREGQPVPERPVTTFPVLIHQLPQPLPGTPSRIV